MPKSPKPWLPGVPRTLTSTPRSHQTAATPPPTPLGGRGGRAWACRNAPNPEAGPRDAHGAVLSQTGRPVTGRTGRPPRNEVEPAEWAVALTGLVSRSAEGKTLGRPAVQHSGRPPGSRRDSGRTAPLRVAVGRPCRLRLSMTVELAPGGRPGDRPTEPDGGLAPQDADKRSSSGTTLGPFVTAAGDRCGMSRELGVGERCGCPVSARCPPTARTLPRLAELCRGPHTPGASCCHLWPPVPLH